MSASSRGSRAAAALIRSSRHPRICSDCISTISQPRRQYAVAAAVLKTTEGTISQPLIAAIPPVTQTEPSPYAVKSGIVLSRPPLLTRPPSPFEKAFYFYQKRLNERLALPFSRYFYFKKDTPADHDWKRKAKERNGAAARELGGYQAYGELGWNDEILVGDKVSDTRSMYEALVNDAEIRGTDDDPGAAAVEGEEKLYQMPLQRWTEADETKDSKRLDRKLARTLYLCVKRENGGWGFPAGVLHGKENLHQAAERILVQSAGSNMNTWVVGHVPVGHHVTKPRFAADASIERLGEKTFFMKGRIMAGQANLKENLFGLDDFKWLTKEEVAKHVNPKYFSSIRNMLADR